MQWCLIVEKHILHSKIINVFFNAPDPTKHRSANSVRNFRAASSTLFAAFLFSRQQVSSDATSPVPIIQFSLLR